MGEQELPPSGFLDWFTRQDELLSRMLEKLDAILTLLTYGAGVVPTVPVRATYITEQSGGFQAGSVSSGTPIDVDIANAIGRKTTNGFIECVTGTIVVRLNGGDAITLSTAAVLNLGLDYGIFEVARVQITASAASTFRLMLV